MENFQSRKMTIIALAMYALASATSAQASEFYSEVAGWTISRDSDSCSMYMQYEGPGETQVLFVKSVDGTYGLAIANNQWSAAEGNQYKIRYILNGKTYTGGKDIGMKSGIAGGFMSFFGRDFEKDLVLGSSLHIELDGNLIDRLSLKGTGAAVTAINRCLVRVRAYIAAADREKKKWGDLPVDPFAAAPRTSAAPSPRGSPASWSTTNDYPTAALRAEHQGRVEFEVKVDVTGRVTDCKVINSSGDLDLDAATCSNVSRRARFNPATDSKGEPTEGTYSNSVNWVIPSD